ncbi:MAG: L,D-transpeptidase [Firmicutes bacterium]|nr:L,D-transpeptidase [Bacillota bacterium]
MWKCLSFLLCLIIALSPTTLASTGERTIVINIPAFTLYVYERGVPIRSYPISIGSELNPSVLGETTIINKVVNPTYYPPNGGTPIPPGPDNPVGTRWLGLGFPGYGIHGTNKPDSIGSAASLGCIRMRNAHVEELTELVQIGTKVELIYRTVVIQEDPLVHTRTITVYPDVYKQGVSPLQLQEELTRLGWEGIFWPALSSLFKLPTGEPHPLAWAWPLRINSQDTGLVAVELNEQFYIPLDLPFDPRNDFMLDAVKWEDDYYLPLQTYLNLTGLGYSKAQGELILHSPIVNLGDASLGNALLFENELYINADSHSARIVPGAMQVVWFWGELYQPATALVESSLLEELTLSWPEGAIIPSFP